MYMEKSASRESESSTQFDSPRSPLRLSSPLSDGGDPHEPEFQSPDNSPDTQRRDNSSAVVIVWSPLHHHSPVLSPLPDSDRLGTPENAPPPVVVINRAVREEHPPPATNLGAAARNEGRVAEEDGRRGRGRTEANREARKKRKLMMRKAALGFRVSEVVLCLISFSVMASDRTQGWSGDSFDRYKEYRYCLSMNVIAFVYAAFQACDLGFQVVTGKKLFIHHHLRYHFDFFMDQVLAYLLISASSSAATRVDDWQSNWGKDQFTETASASVGFSFLAFFAFAISSLISGYNLCSINQHLF